MSLFSSATIKKKRFKTMGFKLVLRQVKGFDTQKIDLAQKSFTGLKTSKGSVE